MKLKTSFALTTLGLATVLVLTNCKKEKTIETPFESNGTARGITRFSGGDRIDEIVKGLSEQDYSFSFDQTYPGAGITRTAYGADSYLGYADPQDVICPEPFRLKQKKIAIWKRPNFIVPTCPDMTIDIWKLQQIQDLVVKADPKQFEGLKSIAFLDKGGFLATEKFTSQYQTMSLDKFDDLTRDLNGERYLLLNAPGDFGGIFRRSFYGYADLNKYVFGPLRTNLKDILKPTLKGCFDPIVLSEIKERLQKVDPVVYKNLDVTTLDQNIGVLSY